MGWGWKALGLGLGAALGGPIGAGIGIALGHAIDSSGTDEESLTDNDALVILVGAFLARQASETNHLDRRERELIVSICSDLVEQPSSMNASVIEACLDEWSTEDDLFQHGLELAASNQDFANGLIGFCWRVASRDNLVDDLEQQWITHYGSLVGISDEDLFYSMLPYKRIPSDNEGLDEAYQLLGVDRNASPEMITERYRQMSRKFHPDRHIGADEVLKELAKEKFTQVASAYEMLQHNQAVLLRSVSADSRQLVSGRANQLVRCYFCDQKCRLPAADHLESARCPKCQALLLFENDLAEAVFSAGKS